jgi:hypothetical protein
MQCWEMLYNHRRCRERERERECVCVFVCVCVCVYILDRDSGIATRYRLVGPGIESRWWRDFLHPSRPSLVPIQPPVQWVPGLPGGKAAGAWR